MTTATAAAFSFWCGAGGYKADVLCRLGALHSDAGSFDQAQELLNVHLLQITIERQMICALFQDACDMADGTWRLADTLCELGRFSLKRGNAISSEVSIIASLNGVVTCA